MVPDLWLNEGGQSATGRLVSPNKPRQLLHLYGLGITQIIQSWLSKAMTSSKNDEQDQVTFLFNWRIIQSCFKLSAAPDGPHGERSCSFRPAPGTLQPEVRTTTATAVLSSVGEIWSIPSVEAYPTRLRVYSDIRHEVPGRAEGFLLLDADRWALGFRPRAMLLLSCHH